MEKKYKTSKLNTKPKIIVITGAESTGKSVLTEQLSNAFNSPYIPEIAREYVGNLNRKYTYQDVEQIARIQIEQLKNAKQQAESFVFVDTWLIIIKVWFEFVYNITPDWLIEEIRSTKIDLFLICDIDLPWIDDPVRENGGENRAILQNLYIKNIVEFGFNYRVVSGSGNQRLTNAIRFIEELNQN